MRRQEFMIRLRELLADLPEADKEDALRFYNEYFDDAGPENEETVLVELVSPETISKMLHEEIGTKQYPIPMRLFSGSRATQDGTFREFEDSVRSGAEEAAKVFGDSVKDGWQKIQEMDRGTRNTRIALLILLVLLVIVCAPFVGTAFGLLFGLAVAPFVLVIACGTGSVVLIIAAVLVWINALAKLPESFGGSMTLMGAGFLLLSLACLLMLGTRGAKKVLHWCVSGIKKLAGWVRDTWNGRIKR
ncbi:MAG: hypothetical protein K6E92_08930 [Lachnospiraceae bacterium]|nr:hypothetical protein [Lachnospiraceae bacterium]